MRNRVATMLVFGLLGCVGGDGDRAATSKIAAAGGWVAAPLLVVSEFDESGKITRQSSLVNEWTLVKQAAGQMSGLSGAFYRLFVGRIDSEMHKAVPAQS